MKNVLMIAFHYPPFRGSSGIQRTLKFSQYLSDHGWHPVMLTANPRAYPQRTDDQLHEIPGHVPVKRAFGLDASRHLSIRGFYPSWIALPDRWSSWWLGAVPAGLSLIRKCRPQVIWSTYPIATAHLIGLTLHRLTGLPWVADFRDSMLEDQFPSDPLTRRSFQWLEKKVIQYSSRIIFTTESARRMYLARYPELSPERCLVIPNGYDEEDFTEVRFSERATDFEDRPIRLLHAGVIYQDERDPSHFFRALARLKKEGQIGAANLRIELRASGSESHYEAMIRGLGIDDLVHLLPALPYREALQACADADGLLLFQAASCNHLIPAKVYEYIRLRRPILALTADESETATLLKKLGGATIVDLSNEQLIYLALRHFLAALRSGTHPLPDGQQIHLYARKNQAYELADCLSRLIKDEGS